MYPSSVYIHVSNDILYGAGEARIFKCLRYLQLNHCNEYNSDTNKSGVYKKKYILEWKTVDSRVSEK